jgi:hypothetical protein
MLLAVLSGDGETASCFRVEYALLLFVPLMPQLVDAAYDLIPGQLWVETLEDYGMGELAVGLEGEIGLRNDRRLGMSLKGKLGSMLGNDKNDEKDVEMGEGDENEGVMGEDVAAQFGQLGLTKAESRWIKWHEEHSMK